MSVAEPSMPPEGELIAQTLSDGFALLDGTLTRLEQSEPVAAPRQTRDGHVHTEACAPLVGDDYPPHWCSDLEDGWQALVDDVDTDQWMQEQRALSLSPVESVARECVGGVCPRPFGTGDDRHHDTHTPTDTTRH